MWVAVMLLCYDMTSLSCMVSASPESFNTEEACMATASSVALEMRKVGVYSVPGCFQIGRSV